MHRGITQLRFNWFSLFAVFAGAFVLIGCTDGRRPVPPTPRFTFNDTPPPRTTLVPAADLKFRNQNTEVLSLATKGGSLYMTGRPFGFMRMEVGQDAENPQVTFAIATMIDQFMLPNRPWVVDWYASGALGVMGGLALLSGTRGVSAVNISETSVPREIGRYPDYDIQASLAPADEAFIYKAIIAHPTRQIFYGLREQDFLYTLTQTNGKLNLVKRARYGESSVCCVNNAVFFNGFIYVAFRSKLVAIPVMPYGSLGPQYDFPEIQAVYVAASEQFLYVHHEPNYSQQSGLGYPAGIYVFDKGGGGIARMDVDPPPYNFAASQDDRHLFINFDNTSLQVHRIDWQLQ